MRLTATRTELLRLLEEGGIIDPLYIDRLFDAIELDEKAIDKVVSGMGEELNKLLEALQV